MTTTEGITQSAGPLDPVLQANGFKKVTNGQWERQDGEVRVYSFGNNPLTGWKIFQKRGKSWTSAPGATGEGPADLDRFLKEHYL